MVSDIGVQLKEKLIELTQCTTCSLSTSLSPPLPSTVLVSGHAIAEKFIMAGGGFNPVGVNSVTYIGTLAVFLVAMKVPEIFVKHFPATGCLFVSNDAKFAKNQDLEYLFVGLWSLHFLRRTIEVLFVHDYRRKMSVVESIGAPIYYWFFAFWNGIALRHDNGYRQTFLALTVAGSVMFLLGEFGNCFCHLKLRAFRKEKRAGLLSPNSQHVLPHGFLFECVSCPHYLFEILSWLGFFLASWTLPAALFLLATIITLVTYAHKKYKAYQQEFDGLAGRELYPRNRKALIPFVFWEPNQFTMHYFACSVCILMYWSMRHQHSSPCPAPGILINVPSGGGGRFLNYKSFSPFFQCKTLRACVRQTSMFLFWYNFMPSRY